MSDQSYPGIFAYERLFKSYHAQLSHCLYSWQKTFPDIFANKVETHLLKNKQQIEVLNQKIQTDLHWLNSNLITTKDHIKKVMINVIKNYITMLSAMDVIMTKLLKMINLENKGNPQLAPLNLYRYCTTLNVIIPRYLQKPERVLYTAGMKMKKHHHCLFGLFDKTAHLIERCVGHHHSLPSENEVRNKMKR